jgi:hypothetical protein
MLRSERCFLLTKRAGEAGLDLQYVAEARRPFMPGIRQELRPGPRPVALQSDLAPHLEFVDLGGHGYAKVRLSADAMRSEFICIPRPITRSEKPDAGPLRYRTLHTAALWKSGERPQLKTSVLEGDPGLAI